MPFMTWNDNEFSVNIKTIDTHHKRLFGLINDLYDAMIEKKARDVLEVVLIELINYTVYHFQFEEKLFQEYGYDGYAQHKKEHDDLTQQVLRLKDKFDKDQTGIMLTIETMDFLKGWLKDHICGADKKFAPFLNSKGVA